MRHTVVKLAPSQLLNLKLRGERNRRTFQSESLNDDGVLTMKQMDARVCMAAGGMFHQIQSICCLETLGQAQQVLGWKFLGWAGFVLRSCSKYCALVAGV